MKNYVYPMSNYTPAFWGVSRSLAEVLDDMQSEWRGSTTAFTNYEFEEKEDTYHLSLDIPGIAQKDLEMQIQDDVLCVTGTRKGKKFTHRLILPKDINQEKIEANMQDGVLYAKFPKHEKARPRKITINTSGTKNFLQRVLDRKEKEQEKVDTDTTTEVH